MTSPRYAILGDLLFRVLVGWEQFDATRGASYAEHKVIEGKPKLQYTGENLETLNITMRFHMDYCEPDLAISHLRKRLSDHKAMALVLTNGFYRGRYVLTELVETLRHTDGEGNTILMDVRVALKEWAGSEAADSGEAMTSGGTLPGSVRS